MLESEAYRPLDVSECRQLAAALGDKPDTTIEVHALERGLCRAFVVGSPLTFDAALVEAGNLPAEPHGFAEDPDILCTLLESVRGWNCVLVDRELAGPLERLVRRRITPTTRVYESVHLALLSPVAQYRHPVVRPLGVADLPLIAAASEELRPDGFATLEECLTVGIVAGALVDGQLVSVAHVDALTTQFGEISIHTLAEWRGQGMASASASLVAHKLQDQGRTPVWYAGADNGPSLHVAEKLGFVEVSRPVYVIRNHS